MSNYDKIKPHLKCANCDHARQVGDRSCQTVVGCALIALDRIAIDDVYSKNIHKGYMYNCRRVGDVADSRELEKGALIYSTLVDSDGICERFQFVGT